MDDEQKQNLHNKGMQNTEANVDQSNIVTYDRREGFLPVWWHNVYGTRSTAMAIQNDKSPALASYGFNTVNVAPSYGPNTNVQNPIAMMPRPQSALSSLVQGQSSDTDRNMQTEATPNAPTDGSLRPMPRTSDAGTSNQSRNMQTEPNVNDTSLDPNPKTCDAGSAGQSSS